MRPTDRVQLLLRIAYDGGRFYGVTPQPNRSTVSSALSARLRAAFGQPPRVLTFTSRTDGGVHALGNLATTWFSPPIDLDAGRAALRQERNDGLLQIDSLRVPPTVFARDLAVEKWYRYLVVDNRSAQTLADLDARLSWRGRQPERLGLPHAHPPFALARRWHIHPRLNEAAMTQAAQALVGTHDFSAFRSRRCRAPHPIRTINAITIQKNPTGTAIDIRGDAFLRQMVRIIAGTLIEVGVGLRPPETVEKTLASGDRTMAGFTAPSRGLTLMHIQTAAAWFPSPEEV